MRAALFSRQSLVLQNGPPRALLWSSGGLQVHLFLLVNFGGGTAGTMAIQVVQHSLRPSVDLVFFARSVVIARISSWHVICVFQGRGHYFAQVFVPFKVRCATHWDS